MSIKSAQHTKFDKLVQTPQEGINYYRRNPEQVLLPFDGKRDTEAIPEKELKELDLVYPELKPEHISTKKLSPEQELRLSNDLKEEMEQGSKHRNYYGYRNHNSSQQEIEQLKKYLSDNQFPDVIKGRILSKYDELRDKSIAFYTVYKDANRLAMTQFTPNTDGTYADMFREYSKLVVAELTTEIGRLFGSYYEKDIDKFFKEGIKIFNITSLNFGRKIDEMNRVISYMDNVIKDYERRKKLINYLGKKVEEEVNAFLSADINKIFLNWLDNYFPYHKDDFIQKSINQIRSTYGATGKDTVSVINFSDLVDFKSYKSIYEKAQGASTFGFKNKIKSDIQQEVRLELSDQIRKRSVSKFKKLYEFLSLIDAEHSYQDDLNQLIIFLRKEFNIDLRAFLSFSQNIVKKKNTKYTNNNYDYPNAEKDEIEQINKANLLFIFQFLTDLKSYISFYLDDTNKWSLDAVVEKFIKNIITPKYGHLDDLKTLQKILELNSKELENYATLFVMSEVLEAVPGAGRRGELIPGSTQFSEPSSMRGIRKIIELNDGKFSIESFTNYAHSHIPFVPKELLFSSIRTMFKDLNNRGLNRLENLKGTNHQNTVKFFVELLKSSNKLEHNSFYKLFNMLEHYSSIFATLNSNLPKSFTNEEVIELMLKSVRNLTSLDKDLENLNNFVAFIHNEAGSLSAENIKKIISNQNFINYGKVGIVKKLINSYVHIKNIGGVKSIYKNFGPIITDLRRRKFISSNFKENILMIENFFDSNQDIGPQSTQFAQLFESTSKIESDLAVIQMGEALKDLLKDYTPKNKNLFKIDQNIGSSLRFRVLKDKDPRILRIGIETNCCQRIGGAGATAARDSFINPLSSVLILEWLNPENNDWELLSQSYFHYIPNENGYILDNVEENISNINKFESNNPGISIEEIYGVYANDIKNKLKASYVLAGKGFSKIDPKKFSTDKRYKDPRSFDNRALTEKNTSHYSDFDEKNSIDLLLPKFNVDKAREKISGAFSRKAQNAIKSFIKLAMSPLSFIKRAGTASTSIQSTPQPPSHQDIRTLQGVKINLFGAQSWDFINKIMNTLNDGMFKLAGTQKVGNQSVNFYDVVKNPSSETRFTGGLRGLVNLSNTLWQFVIANRIQPYSVDEARKIANQLMQQTNAIDMAELVGQDIKPKLVAIINDWLSILS